MEKQNINRKLKLINKVQSIRSKNNINWMNILKIALKSSPEATLKVLKKINKSDDEINKIIKKI